MQKTPRNMSFDRFLHLGMRALKKGDASRAAEVFHHFHDLRPADARGYVVLAQLKKHYWALPQARSLTRKALLLQPEKLRNYISHATSCADDLALGESLEMMTCALIIQPNNPNLRTHFGLLHLRAGNWRRGFELYDNRGSRRALLKQLRTHNIPLWNGESLLKKHIVVVAEQGAGDVLQFVRYAALLAKRGAKVTVICRENLRALILNVAGVYSARRMVHANVDYGEAIMTLPRHFGVTPKNVIINKPYLVAPPAKELLPATEKLRVGISWTGNPSHSANRERSVPIAELAQIFGLERIEFFSFQFDRDASKEGPLAAGVVDLAPRLGDFAQTASYVKQMDLLITIDSSLAHLSGGLGHPLWLMLARQTDWRWISSDNSTPWYPSMRLFRQTVAGDWSTVLNQIVVELKKLRDNHCLASKYVGKLTNR